MINSVARPAPDVRRFYRDFPKVELHRHLEGSITPEMLLEIADRYGVSLPTHDLEQLKRRIQIEGQVPSLKEFLNRFYLLGLAFPTLEAVEEVTWAVCRQCAGEGVRVVELRFSPVFMTLEEPHPWEELLEALLAGLARGRRDFPLAAGLIIGVSRSNSTGKAFEVIELAERFRDRGLVGLDLFGDEAAYPPELFAEPFAEARRRKLNITIHAGEGGEETNIRTAVEELGASRIGHGVRVINDPELLQWIKARGVALEICLTSNVHTCTVKSLPEHPVRRLYDAGLRISLNTDDPAISATTLPDEYCLAAEVFGFTPAELKGIVLDSLDQSFFPEEERLLLRTELERALAAFPDR